ncbi:hypothetical protein CLPU_9c00880 [Gottschalkia purinilytica]|uniref:Outer membrane lipoprotein-sorting protein n=1 Tax=Gottschalkia purinilytica TaxID=1503 RepID=A0A0L0W9R5_GOTPU|nr:hypothetical protein [Gottschalkia purinilytica]KNF08192.1 hypothetical protein CLPU_9c00880 [Gottschalkia purinilytica]
MIKKKIMTLMTVVALGSGVLVGCNGKDVSLLPESIVANAIEADNNIKSYYAEGEMRIYENNKITEEVKLKEWSSSENGKIKKRSETNSKDGSSAVVVNDGDMFIVHDKKENKVFSSKNLNDMSLISMTPKDQFKKTLETLKESHNISNLGEEKINNIKTYHLKLEPKDKDNILGEQELWINMENWFVIKCISYSGNIKTEFEYTKLDFSPKFDENTFKYDIPSDAKVENLDEFKNNQSDINFEEAKELMGNPILTTPQTSEYKLKEMKVSKYNSKISQDEIIQTYVKDNKPAFTLTIRKHNQQEESENVKIPGEKNKTIRGQKATVLDKNIKIISWDENDVSYSFIGDNNNMKLDECIKIIESLEIKNNN